MDLINSLHTVYSDRERTGWERHCSFVLCPSPCKLRWCSIYPDWLSNCQHRRKESFGIFPGAVKNSGESFITAAVFDVNQTVNMWVMCRLTCHCPWLPWCVQGGKSVQAARSCRISTACHGSHNKTGEIKLKGCLPAENVKRVDRKDSNV